MQICEALKTINGMQADGIIDHWAIGGAVGATFYLEPVSTLDIDVFVAFRTAPGTVLIDLHPIFDYLREHGGEVEGEYVMIAGWPVQFLPTADGLGEEALSQSIEMDVDGVRAWVFTAEHLAAIALQTGRAKDKARLLQFVESDALDQERFQSILTRHGLSERWQEFERAFLEGSR